jgi:hypothetical protein
MMRGMQRKDLDIFPSRVPQAGRGHNSIAGGHWVGGDAGMSRNSIWMRLYRLHGCIAIAAGL